jgi:DMSO/TMAO reductase YedYZ heme-binding membrane subunit
VSAAAGPALAAGRLRGWTLTLAVSAALVALAALQLAWFGPGEEGIRVIVRSSARSSIALFALAFTASSLRSLWRAPATAWLLANRRYVGVSYAVSHAIHLLALVALYPVSERFASDLAAATLVGGGIAYAFTFAMAATSSDAAVRALGRRRWRLLHRIGGWYIWIIFAQSYLPRAFMDAAYAPVALLVLAVPALRIAARARGSAPAAPG